MAGEPDLPSLPDWPLVRKHVLVLVPLAATSLLQRLEHVIDNRFVAVIGEQGLLAHSVSYNFFLIAQAVGAAASTSALICWNREEHVGSQAKILRVHAAATLLVSLAAAALGLSILPPLLTGFGVESGFAPAARVYAVIGLVNMILAALYAPLNALLVASDQRLRSLTNVGTLLLMKVAAGSAAVWALRSGRIGPAGALAIIGLGGTAAIAAMSGAAWRHVTRVASKGTGFEFSDMRGVWLNELGMAGVRSSTPFAYGLLLAKSVSGASLVVTHQLTLHLAYFLTLPQLAGMQLALRDASEEQSRAGNDGTAATWGSAWFRWFSAVSLAPTIVLLALGAALAPGLINALFGYSVPEDCAGFPRLFLAACAIGQMGCVPLITLRARKANGVAMRNLLIAELGVMVGVTAVAVLSGKGTATALGGIVVVYCLVFAGLNFISSGNLTSTPQPTAETA